MGGVRLERHYVWRKAMKSDDEQDSAPAPPAEWLARAATGALVWSATPIAGPMPNYGNGFMAAEFPMRPRDNSAQMFIAGVFSGGLPPPFGVEMGAVSQRAGVALPLMQSDDDRWNTTMLANDFERATIETLQVYDPHDGVSAGGATLRTRHCTYTSNPIQPSL